MTYYTDAKTRWLVDGKEMWMTEGQAEEYQENNPSSDVQADLQHDKPLPDEAGDDYLDCTCADDPPNGTAPTCPACKAYFASLLED